MKTCQCCGAQCAPGAPHCPACGEASFAVVDAPPPALAPEVPEAHEEPAPVDGEAPTDPAPSGDAAPAPEAPAQPAKRGPRGPRKDAPN